MAGGDGDLTLVGDGMAGIDQQVHDNLVVLGAEAAPLGQGLVVVLDHGALVLQLVPDDVEG